MIRRRPPRWVLVLLCAVTLSALLAWGWSEHRSRNRVRLADGREVTVRAVTYGTNHVLVEGPLWVRLLRRQLSPIKAARLGLRVHQRTSRLPSCIVWTHWRVPGTNGPPRLASMRNEQGIESDPIPTTAFTPGSARTEALVAWQWESFPRGQPKNLVRFYDRPTASRPSLAGEMRVRIPAGRGRTQQSSPPAPPVRVMDGGTEFSLISLRGERTVEMIGGPFTFTEPMATAIFSVVESGWPSTVWTVSSLEGIGDAGNHFRLAQPHVRRSFNRISILHHQVLWPEEPGWRIIAEFARMRDYPPEELFTVRGLRAERDKLPLTTNLQVEANGIVLQSLDLRGTGQVWPYVRGATRPTVDLVITYTAKVDRARLDLAKAVDDRGRSLGFDYETHPWKGKYTVALELPPDSVTVDLTFASQRTRFIEFRVKPVWTTNSEPGP